MAYVKTYPKWLPYAKLSDQRGFISRVFGNNHTGIDSVANVYSNNVCAVVDGSVLSVYTSPTLGNVVEYGNKIVKIAHYHLNSVSVQIGKKVVSGETIIGVEGSTGSLSTGKHLHTSVWIKGVLVDPEGYLSGKKKFPKEEEEGNFYMIRKVTKALNLRSTKSLSNDSNIVYRDMPIGTIFLVTETFFDGKTNWGHVYVTIKGKSYSGWSNIAETWSCEV